MTMSALGDLIREARERAGLSIKETALLTGLKNEAKQIRILERLEEGKDRFPKAVYIERFATILRMDLAEVVQAMSLDYAAFEKWCDTAIKPYLLLRAVPGFYLRQDMPEGCS